MLTSSCEGNILGRDIKQQTNLNEFNVATPGHGFCKTKNESKHTQINSVIHAQDITVDQLIKFTIDIYKPIWK